MLPANSSAKISGKISPSLESLSNRVRKTKAAPCYNLCGRTSVAIAYLHLRGNWSGECGVLLFFAAALPPGSGRFRLGHPRRPASAGRAKSLRHSAGTISADRRVLCVALRVVTSGSRGRFVLRCEFRPVGLWPHPSRLSPPVRISRLSLLGRIVGGAVVDADLCQRILPSPAARDHGETSTWIAGCAHEFEPARP